MKKSLFCILLCFILAAYDQPTSVTRIAFGSCSDEDLTERMWPAIVVQKPQLWIWLGDNIYGDTHDMGLLRKQYDQQKADPQYQALLKTCPVIGTWDDHDYGQNDGGKFYAKKNESKEELLRFLDVPANNPVRTHAGVYNSYSYGTGAKKIKVILLDTRSFRDTVLHSQDPARRYDPNPEGDMLGEEQWNWFEQQISNSDAAIHIIGSSIQFISNDHGYEKWGNFPRSRERMIKLLAKYKPARPIIISGDRHIAEVSKLAINGLPQPLYDFTSSGLTHTWASKDMIEKNQYRIGQLVIEKNFGMILIDWSGASPKITFEIRGHAKDPLDAPITLE
ncbi:MAG: alkaline phosphatase family protein [Cyclobacteriaceae bacterium]|nr:alkaline phosphatase family protein [Cyclobacteriaceae bacterium]